VNTRNLHTHRIFIASSRKSDFAFLQGVIKPFRVAARARHSLGLRHPASVLGLVLEALLQLILLFEDAGRFPHLLFMRHKRFDDMTEAKRNA